ncbi:MAG: hypothetical protein Q8L48_19700 [Archangium sp.]|nr:hypothetical protein [Archangium sp.]
MSARVLCLAVLLSAPALAGRPHGPRQEFLEVKPVAAAAGEPTAVFIGGVGFAGWSSSLTFATGFELNAGLGRRLSRHVTLSGQLDLVAIVPPALYGQVHLFFALSANLAWDVLELLRMGGASLPLEAGPELGLGAGMMLGGGAQFALPLILPGAFVRYSFSNTFALGLRARFGLPFWTYAPPALVGDQYIAPSPLDPASFSISVSAVHTY